jgi:rhamnopyranosyl-N-acetylglucosaminyl-diphospho-decaprenol beta-1,3/1,4-galactofuranosyltransferase
MAEAPRLDTARSAIWGVVVTFRRPEVVAATLHALAGQSRGVDHLVVVDNGGQTEVRQLAARHGATYLDPRDNVGPAGGIALAMEHILERSTDDDWILLVDDDDPPPSADTFEGLWRFACERFAADELTAGVGTGGSRYRRRTGTFRRLEDSELAGPVDVDVIFGGSQPLYRCAAVRRVGTFDRRLFWGFEEGDYGLSLKDAGYHLYVDGPAFLRARAAQGVLATPSRTVRTSSRKAAWRRYYSVRNSTVVAIRHGSPPARLVVAAGGAVKGVLALVRHGRPIREVVLPLRGARDGLTGVLGRAVDPGSNVKGH